MKRISIIGIGSPFGDDRIGWDVVEAIDKSGILDRFPHGMVQTFSCSQPAVQLLSLLSGASAAILIDAIHSGAPPGTWRKIDANSLVPFSTRVSSHGLSVPESLELGRALGLAPETVLLYGIEIADVGATAGVGTQVLAAIPDVLHEIIADLQTLTQKDARPDTLAGRA